ncbi:hypothetical protein EGW08_020923 [Elysia chlorotica]|uniref:SCP domain-containing protein n=1 Tax=Elysia chlorotica TaxID=188477 RepID=A0A3S0ZBR5_ELYCH|nr:hypothetical protein EGW08_020923 [Elysia chlorotica]
MKTTLVILLAIGLFIACEADYDCLTDDGSNCNTAPLRTDPGDGTTVCCTSYGSMSWSTRYVNGVPTYKCTCGGTQGSAGGTWGIKPPSTPFEPVSLADFRQQGLQKHNELRARHGCPPLTLSDDLNAYAQNWAERLAREDNMYHSDVTLASGEKLGENLAMKAGSMQLDYKGDEPVQAWYDEISLYDFSKTWGQRGTGHFTQVVWKDTYQVGMGKARTADGTGVYAVASYRGPGNFYGNQALWTRNVPKLL